MRKVGEVSPSLSLLFSLCLSSSHTHSQKSAGHEVQDEGYTAAQLEFKLELSLSLAMFAVALSNAFSLSPSLFEAPKNIAPC